MKFTDMQGQPVSKAQIDRERDYFKTDKAKHTIPVMMTFNEYVAKYVGWTVAGPTGCVRSNP
jgi:hypothetical protein